MLIKELPKGIRELAVLRQEELSVAREANLEADLLSGSRYVFSWTRSLEGFAFWQQINRENFTEFYSRYTIHCEIKNVYKGRKPEGIFPERTGAFGSTEAVPGIILDFRAGHYLVKVLGGSSGAGRKSLELCYKSDAIQISALTFPTTNDQKVANTPESLPFKVGDQVVCTRGAVNPGAGHSPGKTFTIDRISSDRRGKPILWSDSNPGLGVFAHAVEKASIKQTAEKIVAEMREDSSKKVIPEVPSATEYKVGDWVVCDKGDSKLSPGAGYKKGLVFKVSRRSNGHKLNPVILWPEKKPSRGVYSSAVRKISGIEIEHKKASICAMGSHKELFKSECLEKSEENFNLIKINQLQIFNRE